VRALNLILLDIRKGLFLVWYRGILACALFFLVNMTLFRQSELIGEQSVALTLGDYYVSLFTGIKASELRPDRPIILPFLWLAVLSSILYFTLSYPIKDLEGIGKHLIVLSGSRLKWWGAKCIWILIVVSLFFLMWLTVTVIWIIATKGSLNVTVSSNISTILGLKPEMLVQPPQGITEFVIVTYISILALCLFQMLVSLCLTPILAFMTSTAILLLSVYSLNPYLIGNYLMATRSQVFVFSGVDSLTGFILSVGIILAVTVFGGMYFKRMDILVKEN